MRILGSIALVIAGLYFAHSVVSGGLPLYYPSEISALHSLDADAYSLLILILPAIYIPLQLIVGFLLDRYGARRILMSCAALSALGLVLSVAVQVPAIGATGRALHAIGAAFAFVGALYIAARSFDKARFASCAGLVQAVGFAAIGWWYLSAEASASLLDLPRRYYFAAGGAVLLALLFALFSYVRPVQDGADRQGFTRQLLGEIGSVLVRPRLWLIVAAAAFAAVPVGVYAPIWIVNDVVPAQSLSGLETREIAALFVLSFALGSFIAGLMSDGIGRRRGVLFLFQLIAAAAFAILAFAPSINPLHIGALLVAGGFFTGSNVLFYALGNDRAPPHRAGLFLALIHAAFMLGAAGSAYAATFVQPWTDVVDLTQYFAPLCLAVAALLGLIIPDKGPMEVAGPVADWEKTAAKTSAASAVAADDKEETQTSVGDRTREGDDALETDAEIDAKLAKLLDEPDDPKDGMRDATGSDSSSPAITSVEEADPAETQKREGANGKDPASSPDRSDQDPTKAGVHDARAGDPPADEAEQATKTGTPESSDSTEAESSGTAVQESSPTENKQAGKSPPTQADDAPAAADEKPADKDGDAGKQTKMSEKT